MTTDTAPQKTPDPGPPEDDPNDPGAVDLRDDLFDVPPPDEVPGPEDRADYIYFLPNHKPWTIVLYSIDVAHMTGQPDAATAVVHLHALSAHEAAGLALQEVQQRSRQSGWRFADVIFVTEGHHEDLRENTRRYTANAPS